MGKLKLPKYKLITKFGVTDGHYDYHQIAEHHDFDSLKVMASIMRVIPFAKNDRLFIVKHEYNKRLNCCVGVKIGYQPPTQTTML